MPLLLQFAMPTTVARKDERLELRLSSEDKKLITEAAALRGLKPTEFALRVMIGASRRTVERIKTLKFSRRDQIAMIEALLDPPPPNAKLRKAKERYDRMLKGT